MMASPIKRSRPSFRDKVRDELRNNGTRGATLEDLMKHFGDDDLRVKIIVALNELISRREAYLRNGIYRLTTKPNQS